VALLTVLISVLLTAFAWPSVRSSVHDVPIAIVGPAAAAGQVGAALDQRLPDAFEITRVDTTAAAEELIRDRAAYGAIDLSTGTPQVIIASAASAPVAQTLQGVATALAQAQAPATGPAAAVRDLAALPADDPRGAGLAAGALPLVLGGMLAAVLLTSLIRGTGRRVTGALAFAVTGGLAMAAILESWLGPAGLGLGAATMMLVGNPLAGTATAPEMLPGWSGALGQLLPPGAGGQLLRSTAFFDGHGAAHSVTVLGIWAVAGVALCLIGGVRARRATTVTVDSAPEAAKVGAAA
jgi:hypothetical protein